VSFNKNVCVDVALQDGPYQANILLLGDSSTVVDLGTKHVKHFVRHVVVGLNEFLQLSSTDDQVFISEGVGDIPADGAELTTILNDSVEETESKEELLVLVRFCTFLKFFRCECLIGLKYVRPKT